MLAEYPQIVSINDVMLLIRVLKEPWASAASWLSSHSCVRKVRIRLRRLRQIQLGEAGLGDQPQGKNMSLEHEQPPWDSQILL